MRSPKSTSLMEPTLTKALKPMLLAAAQSRMAVPRAPLWLKNATRPAGGMTCANVALRFMAGRM